VIRHSLQARIPNRPHPHRLSPISWLQGRSSHDYSQKDAEAANNAGLSRLEIKTYVDRNRVVIPP
jgi:hypothetical protein